MWAPAHSLLICGLGVPIFGTKFHFLGTSWAGAQNGLRMPTNLHMGMATPVPTNGHWCPKQEKMGTGRRGAQNGHCGAHPGTLFLAWEDRCPKIGTATDAGNSKHPFFRSVNRDEGFAAILPHFCSGKNGGFVNRSCPFLHVSVRPSSNRMPWSCGPSLSCFVEQVFEIW